MMPESEHYRILSKAPLTAVFLKGNWRDLDWQVAVFREVDAQYETLRTLIGSFSFKGYTGLQEDHRRVLYCMGFELETKENIAHLGRDIAKRVGELGWINIEELAIGAKDETPESVVQKHLEYGLILRGVSDFLALLRVDSGKTR